MGKMIDLRSGANAVNALYKLPYIIIRFPAEQNAEKDQLPSLMALVYLRRL